MFDLFPHQKRAIGELYHNIRQGHTRQILGAPTGCGKTVMAAKIALDAVSKGRKVLFVVHMITLVDQAVATFERMGLNVGVLRGEATRFSRNDDIIVASIQSIRARRAPDWVGLIIIDEVHIEHQAHRDLLDKWDLIPAIGLSATPMRSGLAQRYTALVRGPSLRELMDKGYLVPVTAYVPSYDAIAKSLAGVAIGNTATGRDYKTGEMDAALNKQELVGDIIENWRKYGENRPTLVSAINIKHSKNIVMDFLRAGIPAEHIDAKTPSDVTARIMERFKSGETRVLSSVYKLAVGFDAPWASCAVLARPTKSIQLAVQTIGRVLRTHESKSDAIIIDHANVIPEHEEYGLPSDFELPETLAEGDEKSTPEKKIKREIKPRICTGCSKHLEEDEIPCGKCGTFPPRTPTDVTYIDGSLRKYGDHKAHSAVQDADGEGELGWYGEERKQWYLGFLYYHLNRYGDRGRAVKYAYAMSIKKFAKKPEWKWQYHDLVAPNEDQLRWIRYQNIRFAKARKAS